MERRIRQGGKRGTNREGLTTMKHELGRSSRQAGNWKEISVIQGLVHFSKDYRVGVLFSFFGQMWYDHKVFMFDCYCHSHTTSHYHIFWFREIKVMERMKNPIREYDGIVILQTSHNHHDLINGVEDERQEHVTKSFFLSNYVPNQTATQDIIIRSHWNIFFVYFCKFPDIFQSLLLALVFCHLEMERFKRALFRPHSKYL